MNPPCFIEADHSSILVFWENHTNASFYELQFKSENSQNHSDESNWITLTSNISCNSIRKKNLVSNELYFFRVRYQDKHSLQWQEEFSNSSESMQVIPSEIQLISFPKLQFRDSSSITLIWDAIGSKDILGYKLRWREESSSQWNIVSTIIERNIVKKKSLELGKQYYFAIQPISKNDNIKYGFSLSSNPISLAVLSDYFNRILPNKLWTKGRNFVSTNDCLAGKIVAIYMSAHWCGPCRGFTPQLSQFYQKCKNASKPLEIVFCSADHSESECLSYYESSMSWFAIPYDEHHREEIMSTFCVSGIPRLVILAPNGKILVDNAVGISLTIETVDNWISQCSM